MKLFTQKNSNLILVFLLTCTFLVGTTTIFVGAGAPTTYDVPEIQGGYSALQFPTYTGVFNVTTIVGPDNSHDASSEPGEA